MIKKLPCFRFCFFLFFPFFLFCKELEVHLPTDADLPLLYLSGVQTDETSYDWRYLDELRSILEFDVSTNGRVSLAPQKLEWDNLIPIHEHRKHFNAAFWKEQRVRFVLVLEASRKKLCMTAFHMDKNISKTYPEILLTNDLSKDRIAIHHLADSLHKDLFHTKGICSLNLIYTKRTKNEASEWFSEVWVCDADGANAKQITQGQKYCLTPFFLPFGSDADFAFVAHQEGQSKIYKASFQDPTPIPMISLRGNQLLPAISPKGTHLAFISDVAGRPDLFIQHLTHKGEMAGKARQLFSAPRATQASPTLSPNGKEVAFVSDKDGPPRIYVLPLISANGVQKTNPKLLTRKNRENTSPHWSFDGKKIAYSAKVDGIRQIWIYDLEKEEEIQLTTGPEHKENPSWAPDSFHLVYNTESESACELYLINLAQKVPLLLTKGEGQKRFASWDFFH